MPTVPSHGRFQATLNFLLRWVTVGLALAFVLMVVRSTLTSDSSGRPRSTAPTVNSYSDAVALAGPAVVNIYANKLVTEPASNLRGNPLAGRIMGISPAGRPRHRVEQSLGSAVIVTPDGYMLTNHHVISAAVEIQAVLWDGRVIRAEIVGSDPDTDLAVLKVEGSNLPAISFSEETQVRIGDVVLAIGNPFGIGQTVTMGIISATGRHGLNLSTYENLIQTDAAINFGNSGGALVDVEGRLIGINTAHYDDLALGAEGIGFAIPYQTARQVLDELIRQGFVTRGWLGLEVIPLELRNTLSGEVRPVLQVARVYAGGPAEQAGLRPGDLILRFAETDLYGVPQLNELQAGTAPGSTVQISALRAGVPLTLSVTLVQRPPIQ